MQSDIWITLCLVSPFCISNCEYVNCKWNIIWRLVNKLFHFWLFVMSVSVYRSISFISSHNEVVIECYLTNWCYLSRYKLNLGGIFLENWWSNRDSKSFYRFIFVVDCFVVEKTHHFGIIRKKEYLMKLTFITIYYKYRLVYINSYFDSIVKNRQSPFYYGFQKKSTKSASHQQVVSLNILNSCVCCFLFVSLCSNL